MQISLLAQMSTDIPFQGGNDLREVVQSSRLELKYLKGKGTANITERMLCSMVPNLILTVVLK